MRSYSQESSRGGRDGKRSEAIVVSCRPASSKESSDAAVGGQEDREVLWAVSVDVYLWRCEAGEERCDACNKDDAGKVH